MNDWNTHITIYRKIKIRNLAHAMWSDPKYFDVTATLNHSAVCTKGFCLARIIKWFLSMSDRHFQYWRLYIYIKRKPSCINGMELVSLSLNRVFISAESVGRGWCKIAIATQWYQFHTTDKCGFLFLPWITDQYTFMQYTKLVNKYAPL